MIDEANKNSNWPKPGSGTFSTLDDIRGLILAGTAQDIVWEIQAYQAAGANLIVFDLRFRYSDWYQQIELLGKEVLPLYDREQEKYIRSN